MVESPLVSIQLSKFEQYCKRLTKQANKTRTQLKKVPWPDSLLLKNIFQNKLLLRLSQQHMSQIEMGVFFGPPGFCTRPQKCCWLALRLAQEQSVSPRDDITLALETLRGKRNRLKNFIQKSFKWEEGASSCYCVEPANSGAYEKNSRGTGVLQSWYRSWSSFILMEGRLGRRESILNYSPEVIQIFLLQ